MDYSKWDDLEFTDDEEIHSLDFPHHPSKLDEYLRSQLTGLKNVGSGQLAGRKHDPEQQQQQREQQQPQSYLRIHPEDKTKIDPLFLQDPDQFSPEPDPSTGKMEYWGVQNDVDGMTLMMRRMNTQFFYTGAYPELQFVNRLMARKVKSLDAVRPPVNDVILKITMEGISPELWRRFQVPAYIPLHHLQDLVLAPIMGWCRNYHGYLFTDRRDGALFGPKKSQCADMMHIYMNGHAFIDDRLYTLGHILDVEGSEMGFLYDLGDRFRHDIRLERILDSCDGQCKLLDGALACPPEDSKGNPSHQKLLEKWIEAGDDATARSELVAVHLNAPNLETKSYDPMAFDLDVRRLALKAAYDPKVFESARPSSFARSGLDDAESNGSVLSSPVQSSLGLRVRPPGQPGPECIYCGSRKHLKRCSRCKVAIYCSRECQKAHRRQHKPLCVAATLESGVGRIDEL
ncbi:MM3350-like domain-containing protein [Polychytrium aggregatum]|uniref:MM3350-like domain-containing protein n=1 Tax=Polychytrium aggregatum TaxID=110093 RepID=UPI0022FEDCFE|nr:MM3350-like domain-containing protein [Polychytrium aggregatum]KAI9207149.1 MM3350-like domain-containing protein [Polychytrium aggregatum]